MVIMAYREHGRTRLVKYATACIVAILFIVAACRTEGSVPVYRWIDGDSVQISSHRGITSIDGEAANGILFFRNAAGDTIRKTEYVNGKENGESTAWYDNGRVSETRKYVDGRKEGAHFGWYSNGTPKFIYHFGKDVYEGEYIEWYPNGQLYRKQHFSEGHENGLQQAWFPGGQIKSNYIIKNNKRYGLYGTQNCVNVADSVGT